MKKSARFSNMDTYTHVGELREFYATDEVRCRNEKDQGCHGGSCISSVACVF
jgi:hypothetical protein